MFYRRLPGWGSITGRFWRQRIMLGAVPLLIAGVFSWELLSGQGPDSQVTAESGSDAIISDGAQPQVSGPGRDTPSRPGAPEPPSGNASQAGENPGVLTDFEAGETGVSYFPDGLSNLSDGASAEPPGAYSGSSSQSPGTGPSPVPGPGPTPNPGPGPNPEPPPGTSPGQDPTPPPAPTGTLSGTVWQTDIADGPLDGIRVTLWHADGCCSSEAVTDRQGSFALSGLAPGGYRLLFEDSRGLYERGWYGAEDNPDGTIIQIADGGETTITYQLRAVKNRDENTGNGSGEPATVQSGGGPQPDENRLDGSAGTNTVRPSPSAGDVTNEALDDIVAPDENQQQVSGHGSQQEVPAGEPQVNGSGNAVAQDGGQVI